jgi:DNA-binding NtrC family response regulator
MAQLILVVDDDPAQRRILEHSIQRFGYRVATADGGEAALQVLDGPNGGDVAAMILDLVMPDVDGMTVLERMRPAHARLPVIVQTAHGGIDTVVAAMRAGADDFVVKPVSPERLQVSIKNVLMVNALAGEITRLAHKNEGILSFDDLVAVSPGMTQVVKLGLRAAQSNIPILIEGESGVGKEMIARAIQGASDRRGKPFITVNCGALPENLVESILFGHEKGSFTGAAGKHPGKFVEASGGTLFLDEVGELPLDIQVKLLRALQEGEVDPVGAKRPVRVDIRLISATNRNMIDMVKEGRFREDLYYRLNVFPVMVPALRGRLEDIPTLVHHFVARFAAEEGKKISGVRADAIRMLQGYQWPGNVRQLENAVFRAVVLCDGPELTVSDFPQIATLVDGYSAEVPPAPPPRPEPALHTGPAIIGGNLPQTTVLQGSAVGGTSLGIAALTESGQIRKLEDVESDMIRLALERYRGHMSEVARKLGIGRSTLYRKIRDMGLDGEKSQ